jgi:hypothetical protein
MITVEFDEGKLPSVLLALQDAKLSALAAKAAAETYTDEVLNYIAEGKSFTSRTGQTEQSIGWRPEGPEGDGAVVFANAETARFLEEGTGLHGPFGKSYLIRPKPGGGRKALRMPIQGGGFIFRKVVNHPGMKAKPFFFAAFQAREDKMLDAMTSVIARKLGAA